MTFTLAILEEEEGFEPPWLLHPSDFKSAPISLSGTLPYNLVPDDYPGLELT